MRPRSPHPQLTLLHASLSSLLPTDIVFMNTWVPVEPKRLYNPVLSALVSDISEWRAMKSMRQLRHEHGVAVPVEKDSLYGVRACLPPCPPRPSLAAAPRFSSCSRPTSLRLPRVSPPLLPSSLPPCRRKSHVGSGASMRCGSRASFRRSFRSRRSRSSSSRRRTRRRSGSARRHLPGCVAR